MHANFSEKYLTEFQALRALCDYADGHNADTELKEMFFSLYYCPSSLFPLFLSRYYDAGQH